VFKADYDALRAAYEHVVRERDELQHLNGVQAENVRKLRHRAEAAESALAQANTALRDAPTIYADHRDITQWREAHAEALRRAK
jgi:hypothetical protein